VAARSLAAPEVQWILYGVVMIVILFVLPRGIVPAIESGLDGIVRKSRLEKSKPDKLRPEQSKPDTSGLEKPRPEQAKGDLAAVAVKLGDPP